MKTTKVLTLLALGTALVLSSCQNKGFDNEGGEPSLKGIAITATGVDYEPYLASEMGMVKMPSTRVNESHFQALDSIGVFIYTGSANAISPNVTHSANMLYYTKDGTPNSATPPEWTVATAMSGSMLAGTAYFTTAYYPYKAVSSNGSAVVHTVAADQSSAAVQGTAKALELSDFMWAKGVAITTPSTTPSAVMNFEHRLTKLVLNLQIPTIADGKPVSKLNSIAIRNLNTTATIDLGTGVFKSLTNVQDIKPRLLSGNLAAGTAASYEVIVVPQTAATGVVLVEAKVQTAEGEKVVNYFPPAAGLELGGGKKITLALSSAADIAFISEVDLVTGQAYTDLPLRIKVASGAAWTLTAPAGSWITVSKTTATGYAASITGTGTGLDETIYVKATANTGVGATPREAVLTLTATVGGSAKTVTYTAVQNYSKPVIGFPVSSVVMETNNYKFPAVVGNSNWYIKADKLPSGIRLSRKNTDWSKLTAADTINLVALSTTEPKNGYMVSGNYYNSNEALYIIVNPDEPQKFTMTCNGINIPFDSRTLKITNGGYSLLWAKGNLIAEGNAGCKVGTPYDAGLYFQFGSLIGYKGGATGTGAGMIKIVDRKFWNDADTFSWDNDVCVVPTGYTSPTDKYPRFDGRPSGGYGYYYYSTLSALGANFQKEANGYDVAQGIGDVCTHYLGSPWRLPTYEELSAIVNSTEMKQGWTSWNTEGLTASWVGTPGVYTPIPGAWCGPAAKEANPSTSTSLFFTAAGGRHPAWGGGFCNNVGANVSVMSGSIYNNADSFALHLGWGAGVTPRGGLDRSYAVPVRCVYVP